MWTVNCARLRRDPSLIVSGFSRVEFTVVDAAMLGADVVRRAFWFANATRSNVVVDDEERAGTRRRKRKHLRDASHSLPSPRSSLSYSNSHHGARPRRDGNIIRYGACCLQVWKSKRDGGQVGWSVLLILVREAPSGSHRRRFR